MTTNLMNFVNRANSINADKDDEEIANLFIKQLLEMNHIATITKLDNYYYQLLLFLDKDGYLYNDQENEHFMRNDRIALKKMLPEISSYGCAVYVDGVSVSVHRNQCNTKWYLYLKKKFPVNQHYSNDNKIDGYSSDHKCPELFELIVRKLEELEYSEESYIRMSDELKELDPKVTNIEKEKIETSRLISEARLNLDKLDVVKNENQTKLLEDLENYGKKIKALVWMQQRHKLLKSLIIPDNIRKVKNIKMFTDAVKSTEEYKLVVKKREDANTHSHAQSGTAPSAPLIQFATPIIYNSGYVDMVGERLVDSNKQEN